MSDGLLLAVILVALIVLTGWCVRPYSTFKFKPLNDTAGHFVLGKAYQIHCEGECSERYPTWHKVVKTIYRGPGRDDITWECTVCGVQHEDTVQSSVYKEWT